MADPVIVTDLEPGQLIALLRANGEAAYARGSLCHKMAGAIDHLVQGAVPADAVTAFIDSHADLLLAALPDAGGPDLTEAPDADA